jgi:hypothetical protein
MSATNGGPAAGDAAARAAVERVLRRDRRLVRAVTGVAVVLWVLVLAAVVWLLYLHFTAIVPRTDRMLQEMHENPGSRKVDVWNTSMAVAVAYGLAIAVGVIGVLSFAMMSTVALVFASRRATLRQINLSLVEISNQLRELRQAAPPPAVSPPPAG